MMRSNEKKFIFIHIPKTGGTTVSYRLAQYAITTQDRGTGLHKFHYDTNLHDGIRDHPYYLSWYKKYFSFTFVRNPWERLFSFYMSTRRYEVDWDKICPIDFHNFCNDVRDDKYRLSPLAKRPQLHQITNKDSKVLINFVGRFENFEKDFSEVCQRLDIFHYNTDVGIMNRSNYNDLDYHDLYMQEDIDWVAEIFNEDIKVLNYNY